jgi:hypothetical protein
MALRISRDWRDWCRLLLGIWVCVSPGLLQFTDDSVATRNLVGVGFLIIVAEVFTFSMLRELEEWINLALSAWLAASAFVLDITSFVAKANSVVSGVLIVLLSLYEIWDSRRPADRQPSLSSH